MVKEHIRHGMSRKFNEFKVNVTIYLKKKLIRINFEVINYFSALASGQFIKRHPKLTLKDLSL